jgi:hypothetical protein
MKYIRKKGRWKNGESKYIIEENNSYLLTLPRVDQLFEILRLDCLENKPSQKEGIIEQK